MKWETVKLAAICEINMGKTPSRNEVNYWGGKNSWVAISDLKSDIYISKTKECITDLALKESGIKPVAKGTLLYSFKLSIGKVAITGKEIYTNEAIVALPIKDIKKVDLKYLYYAIQQVDLAGIGDKAVKGVNGEYEMAYKYRIDLNVIPQIDLFLDNGYTKEEMKMVNETKKIMRDDSIRVTATTVRIPVMGGHSEAVNVEFLNDYDLNEVKSILQSSPGIVVVDDTATQQYPMPIDAHEKDEVFVGRLRRDESQAKTLNMWIVSDNLRKGAATNAVQIAEYLLSRNLL